MKTFTGGAAGCVFSAWLLFGLLAVTAAGCGHGPARRFALAGYDSKAAWVADKGLAGKQAGQDAVFLLDFAQPGAPRLAAAFPLANSIYGPPTNVAIDRHETFALVANSMKPGQAPEWKGTPDDTVAVIDLKSDPPRVVGQVKVGLQPSGIDIAPSGAFALVANRAGRSVTLLAIDARGVTVANTLDVNGEAADVAFFAGGTRALCTIYDRHSVVVLEIVNGQVKKGAEILVGSWPYSIAVTPDGRLALTGDMGQKTGSDGKSDTVSVIDLSPATPVVVGSVKVGDGPEGLAISPDGKRALVVVLDGSNAAASEPFYHPHGLAVGLAIDSDGKTVRKLNQVRIGGMGEGAVFGPEGKFVYVGNFIDGDLSILRFDGETLVDTGRRYGLPGGPASMQ